MLYFRYPDTRHETRSYFNPQFNTWGASRFYKHLVGYFVNWPLTSETVFEMFHEHSTQIILYVCNEHCAYWALIQYKGVILPV